MSEDPMNAAVRRDRERMGLLPCGHAPEVEDDQIINDQCFECGWMTPHRKQANVVNEAATSRRDEEVKMLKYIRKQPFEEDGGMSVEEANTVLSFAIRVRLRYTREEALREQLKSGDY